MWKEFIFSCSVFGGYRVLLPLTDQDTLDSLVQQCCAHLEAHLKHYHLEALVDRLHTLKYHIHTHSLEDLRNLDTPVYVCTCQA